VHVCGALVLRSGVGRTGRGSSLRVAPQGRLQKRTPQHRGSTGQSQRFVSLDPAEASSYKPEIMTDDIPVELESKAARGRSDRLWLPAIGVVSLSLFLLAPLVGDTSRVDPTAIQESAALADTLIERGLTGVRAQTTSLSPVGFLARWTTALALLLNPTDDDGRWARAFACLLWALSWWGLTRFVAGRAVRLRGPEPWILLGVLLLSGPARAAALGEISGAIMLAAGVGFALSCQRLVRGPDTTWSMGVIWGLLALLHPALLALGVPIFIFAAGAYRDRDDDLETSPGHAPLPHVPLSLIASPVVATAVILVLWTAAGGGVRDLGTAIDQLWRLGGSEGGPGSLGPSPGAAIGEGLAALGWLPTVLALMGSALPGRSPERRIAWFVLATILLVGGLDGRLHDPSANLMLFSLPFIAALALKGPLVLWKKCTHLIRIT
jgi:hypothetical protein